MTHDQHIASDPALSAWVSASAGTGKTKVLTDRVLRLLLAGTRPEGILCITYTKAASAEMESRIHEELARWAMAQDDALAEALTALTSVKPTEKMMRRARRLFATVLDAPERIRIKTIHSFCQSVLARFPVEAELPPHFTLIDDITSRELLAEARAQLFLGAKHNDYGEALAAIIAIVSEKTLYELLNEIVSERRKFADWLAVGSVERIREALDVEEETEETSLLQKHFNYMPDEEHLLKVACDALSQATGKSDRQACAALQQWLKKRDDVDAYLALYLTKDKSPRKQLFTKEAAGILPALAEIMAAEQRRTLRFYEERQTLRIAAVSTQVAKLAEAQLGFYQRIKQRHAYLDYDDLILNTVRLLHKPGIAPWVLFKLDGGIDHLLIDEAQDTSPEQWRIVDALASEFFAGVGARNLNRTLFVVGDEKQSIFSFQGAAPQIFDSMQHNFSKLARNAEMDFKRVQLALSFRSTASVLEAVDTVFAQDDARDGLVFGEGVIRHEVSRIGAAGRVELWPLVQAPQEDSLPAWHVPGVARYSQRPETLCAEQVAQTIESWLKGGRIIPSAGRQVRPGDIMILVQRRGAFADSMLRALKRRNIPVAGADRLVLTEHIAVADCMKLAHFLLLPQDDLTLAEVLKSPFLGLNEEDLFTLAYQREGESLWHRLCTNAKYEEASRFLSDLLAVTDYLPPYELFAHILETCGGRKKLLARLGDEIEDPLGEFLALALAYGKTHTPSLQGFLHWLETGATQIKRDMEKGMNEVRILTTHGAKGLQAPIVFLPDSARMPPHEGGIFWTEGENSVPLWSPGTGHDDRHYGALRRARRLEAEREYRRLLYVAMTRAEDELYVCGWQGSKAVESGCWYELLRRAAHAWPEEDGKHVLVNAQSAPPKAKRIEAAVTSASFTLPAWAHAEVRPEPIPPRPLSPSGFAEAGDALSPAQDHARARGILIHRLLQYLPDAAAEQQDTLLARLLSRYGEEFSQEERARIGEEAMAIIHHPEFAPVFGPGSVAEASIAGIAGEGGAIIAGRVDRIAVTNDSVYIIDYKTARRVPENVSDVPDAYLRQMDAYRQLANKIYPDKTVYCALLWTAAPRLMLLPDALLGSLAA